MRKTEDVLVILSPAFPPKESGTEWVPAQQLLVKELKRQFPGLAMVVISFFYPAQKIEYVWNDVRVIPFDAAKKKKLRRVLLWRNVWKKINRIKNEGNLIGLLSFWCGECALIGSWFAKLNHVRHYCWICGQDARRTNKLVKWIRPKSDELIAISDFLTKEFYTNHKVKPAHVIPIAIDRKMFPELPCKREFDIIGAGSFSLQKNYDQFVWVIAALKERFPGLRAVHCGSGEDEENIRKLVKKLNLEQTLELRGLMPHAEVIPLMQHAKILLHPSTYEGFGMVHLEALYAGSHVISFTKAMDHPIQNWHVVKDKNEMINKTIELFESNLSHERVLVYSIENTAKKIMQLFT